MVCFAFVTEGRIIPLYSTITTDVTMGKLFWYNMIITHARTDMHTAEHDENLEVIEVVFLHAQQQHHMQTTAVVQARRRCSSSCMHVLQRCSYDMSPRYTHVYIWNILYCCSYCIVRCKI